MTRILRKSFLKRNLIFIAVGILIACIFFVCLIVREAKKDQISTDDVPEIATTTIDYSPELAGIQAKAYYVYDLDENKVLFAKDEHEELPLASVTKLMSGLVIMNNLPASTIVNIRAVDLGYDGNGGKLVVGEKWNPQSLLNYSLIMSSNDGIMALARTLDAYEGQNASDTVALMNHEAEIIGLHNTIFMNPTGLDLSATTSGAYSSAYDVTMLLKTILRDDLMLVSHTTRTSEDFVSLSNIEHVTINTDASINEIPNLIASKTGYTDLAGGNLAIAYDAGFAHPIISVVLGSTEDGRFTDMEKLVHVTLERLSQ
jgi:D-alanyl-D-alanine carboxypeptidase